jgi:hypothetical protein
MFSILFKTFLPNYARILHSLPLGSGALTVWLYNLQEQVGLYSCLVVSQMTITLLFFF